MAYSEDKAPDGLTELTTLASGDVFVVGDVSDAVEEAKYITKANLLTDFADETQTLTNKTINTASNTITVVEADISDLGSYITASSTDTLTNKTIDGDNNTISNLAIGAEVSATPTADLAMNGLNIDNAGVIFLTEQADADADVAGQLQLWANTATPNEFWYTNDAGTDFQVASLAGTETFTNKTINTASNTITINEADISDLGSYITASSTDTLTNKTINTASNTITINEADISDLQTYLLKSTNFKVKGITVENPDASEDLTMFFTDDAITVTQMNAVLANGSATPSVTWTIRHGTDRSAAGAEVVTSGTTTTSTTTGSEVTAFNDATIVAGSWVWLETTAQSGTVPELHVTIEYTVD